MTDGVDIAVPAGAELAESPVWDCERGSLLWVDIPAGEVHRYEPGRQDHLVVTLEVPIGAVAVRSGGGLVLAAGNGFALHDEDLARTTWLASVERGDRMNDGKCDPAGRFWAGSLIDESHPGGAGLYRLETDRRVVPVLEAVTLSNGLDWSPDTRTMYYVDTPTRTIAAFDYDLHSGTIAKQRLFADLRQAEGRPDGLSVDAEGGVWVAMANGWSVRRYCEDGRLDRTIRLPVQKVTSCAFGGTDLRDLYITSARDGLSAEAAATQPHAGAVFHTRPGIQGLPPNLYGHPATA